MRRQRNMAQMTEQDKTLEKELNKMEIINLLYVEFKTLVIRMLKELSKNINSIKKDQPKIKDTLTEMQNDLQGINDRVDDSKNQISDLKYKESKNTLSGQQKEKRIQKNENCVRSLWGNFKSTHICIMGVPEEKERDQGIENLFEK